MADWLFDGPNKVVYEPSGSGDTSFNVERDLYSAWKRWVSSGEGSRYTAAFSPEGGTPIGNTGIFTGKTIVLINGWKVRAANHSHQVTLNGNLFSDDGVVSVPTQSFNATIFVNSSVAAQGVAISGATAEQTTLMQTILDILEADEEIRTATYRKLHKDTKTPLVTKSVTRNGNDIDLVE